MVMMPDTSSAVVMIVVSVMPSSSAVGGVLHSVAVTADVTCGRLHLVDVDAAIHRQVVLGVETEIKNL